MRTASNAAPTVRLARSDIWLAILIDLAQAIPPERQLRYSRRNLNQARRSHWRKSLMRIKGFCALALAGALFAAAGFAQSGKRHEDPADSKPGVEAEEEAASEEGQLTAVQN